MLCPPNLQEGPSLNFPVMDLPNCLEMNLLRWLVTNQRTLLLQVAHHLLHQSTICQAKRLVWYDPALLWTRTARCGTAHPIQKTTRLVYQTPKSSLPASPKPLAKGLHSNTLQRTPPNTPKPQKTGLYPPPPPSLSTHQMRKQPTQLHQTPQPQTSTRQTPPHHQPVLSLPYPKKLPLAL